MRNDSLLETIQYRGIDIEIHQDTNTESPDEWGNDDAFIVYDHRNFCVERKGFDPTDIFEAMQQGRKLFDGYFFFPVYAYIHSGVALSLGRSSYPFTCRWDTSFKGFALVKRQQGYGTREKAHKLAQGIVDEWNMYLSGDVYGYTSEHGSCWGFYGKEGRKQMIEEAKGEIDYALKEQATSHFEQVKKWIKNNVPLIHREPMQLI